MLYLGIILSIVFYTIGILLFVGYIVLFIMKKNAILESFVGKIFLLFMVEIMFLSWSLIIMNRGFNVNLFIQVDYSYVLLIVVPILITYEVFDTIQRKKIQRSERWYMNAVRYLLPVLTGILFFACTLIFYFNCHYFAYLRMLM